ncbi:hypothetical protein H6504_05450 [Candidatus Woesearchaeota archaeon]|nr:hypothetical protein [Candidatus Woesearchaeota archaeon]
MKSKVGQISLPFLIFAGVIILLVLIMYGGTILDSFTSLGCTMDEDEFKAEIESMARAIAAADGTVDTYSIKVPSSPRCKIDRVFFFDRDNAVFFDGFEEIREMHDQLHSKTDKNVFLLRGDQVIHSLSIDRIGATLPYFTCVDTGSGYMEIYAENFQDETKILPLTAANDCTYEYIVPLELDFKDALFVLRQIFMVNQSRINDSIVDPLAVNLTKTIKTENGWTVVNVSKGIGKFDYFEYIPKCAMESFVEAQNNGYIDLSGATGWQNLSDDPLIMWEFDESDEQSIQYKLQALLDPQCLRQVEDSLAGIALSNTSYPGLTAPEIADIQNTRLDSGTQLYDILTTYNMLGAKTTIDNLEVDFENTVDKIAGDVRKAPLVSNDKTDIIIQLDEAKKNFKRNPSFSRSLFKSVKLKLWSKGLGHFIPDKLEQDWDSKFKIVEGFNSKIEELSGVTPVCSVTGFHAGYRDICDDGTVVSDYCIDSSKLMQVQCQVDDTCGFTMFVCAGGETCINGECRDLSSICVDNDGSAWRDTHVRDWNVVQDWGGHDLCIPGGNPGCRFSNVTSSPFQAVVRYEGEKMFIGSDNLNDDNDMVFERYIDNDAEICFRLVVADMSTGIDKGVTISHPEGYCSVTLETNGVTDACCSSTDEEKGIFEKGGGPDVCVGPATVEEDVCYNDAIITESVPCPVGYTCVAGECVPPPPLCHIETAGLFGVPECFESGFSMLHAQSRENGIFSQVNNVYCDGNVCQYEGWLTVGDNILNCNAVANYVECWFLLTTAWTGMSTTDKVRYGTLIRQR